MPDLTDAQREEITRLFGYVPEPEPLEQMLSAVEQIVAEHVAQVEAERDEERRLGRLLIDVANGDGFTIEARGVKFAKCDTYGKTEDEQAAEARYAALVAGVRDALEAPRWRDDVDLEWLESSLRTALSDAGRGE